MLTREEILSKTKLKTETVNVPEWGGPVFVSEMTGEARERWELSLQEKDEKGRRVNLRANLIIATVVDASGNNVFLDDDAEIIGKLSANSLLSICDVAQRLNGLREEDVKRAEKN
jgi:hypothetical protein